MMKAIFIVCGWMSEVRFFDVHFCSYVVARGVRRLEPGEDKSAQQECGERDHEIELVLLRWDDYA